MDRTEVTRAVQAAYDSYAAVHHSSTPRELFVMWGRWVPAWFAAVNALSAYARKRSQTVALPQKMGRKRDGDLTLRWLWLAATAHDADARRAPWRMNGEEVQLGTAVLPDGDRVPPPGLLGLLAIAQAGHNYLYAYSWEVFPERS